MKSNRWAAIAFGWLGCAIFTGTAAAQPSAPLYYIQTISVPGWTNTGANQANLDIFAFNPYTRVMYIADRTNHAITAVDTIENQVVGVLPVPGNASPNGVLVAIDLQKLVVTD